MADNITVYAFAPGFGTPSMSAFCTKLISYLRMTNLPHEVVVCNDPRKGPKGKLPYIEIDGKKMGDSTLIINYLKQTRGDPLDKNLSPQQKAISCAIQSLLEDHLYWVIMWSRWIEPTGWQYLSQHIFQAIPWPLRGAFRKMIHNNVKRQLHEQGMARHTAEEIINFGKHDIDMLAILLGDKPFMLGNEPTSIDAIAHAFISAIWFARWHSELTEHLTKHTNLLNYCQRMAQRYYPELPQTPRQVEAIRKAA